MSSQIKAESREGKRKAAKYGWISGSGLHRLLLLYLVIFCSPQKDQSQELMFRV